MINTGKLKINKTGQNISSAQSVQSGKPNAEIQAQRLKQGKAQMLDMSFVSAATEKQKLDESFQSNTTMMSQQSQKQKEEILKAQAKQREKLERMQQDALNSSQISQSSRASQSQKSQMSSARSKREEEKK